MAAGIPARRKLTDLLDRDVTMVEQHVREGRFQRALALITAFASFLSGFQVLSEHYRAGYGRQVMYTPVLASPLLSIAGIATVFSRRAARIALPLTALLTIADGLAGFYFHVVNIDRRPGGWRLPIVNIVMGPPVLAPLLFGLSGYLGLIASLLRREDDPNLEGALPGVPRPPPLPVGWLPRRLSREGVVIEHEVREGRFQQQLAAAAALTALLSGLEAAYSHYKDGFNYRVEWTPILLSPLVVAAGMGAIWSRTIARTLLPATSALAVLDGTVGFYYHARGILRRPGGSRLALYNVLYGPPLFAPLLFAASGFMGLVATFLRRAD